VIEIALPHSGAQMGMLAAIQGRNSGSRFIARSTEQNAPLDDNRDYRHDRSHGSHAGRHDRRVSRHIIPGYRHSPYPS
jgi:hypothetical protein